MIEVSVVMAVYNGEKYLKEAIDSVLAQTYTEFEFIIINDGSTDNTAKILQSIVDSRVKIISQENTGAARARNNAIAIAKGNYIAIIDSDDVCLEDRLEQQLNFLKNNPEYVLVGSNAIVIDKEGKEIYISSLPTSHLDIVKNLKVNCFYNSAVCFQKDVFNRAGGYNELFYNNLEDVLLWILMSKMGKVGNLSKALIRYRMSPHSISLKSNELRSYQNQIICKFITNNSITEVDVDKFSRMNSISQKKKIGLYHLHLAKIYLSKTKSKRDALKNILQSFINYPNNFGIVKQLAKMFYPFKQ